MRTVWFTGEAVEHDFRAGGRDRKDRSVAVRAAVDGRAVERAVEVEEARIRAVAVGFTGEAVEHGFRAGERELEHGSAIAGGASTMDGGAVECARALDEVCPWVFTVSRADLEAVEDVLRAGCRDREDRAAEATAMAWAAPVFRGAVERALDLNEWTRVRVSAVTAAFETVEHAVRWTRVRSFSRNSGGRWARRRASASAPRYHGC